jgi:hypothetical protein
VSAAILIGYVVVPLFGVSWTPKLGNPRVRLIIAGAAAIVAGLIALRFTVGL